MDENTVYDKYGDGTYPKKNSNYVQIRKRWIYLLAFLFVAVPATVGIVVWRVHVDKDVSSQTEATVKASIDGIPNPDKDIITNPITPASNPQLTISESNPGLGERTISPVSNPKLTTSDPNTGVSEGTLAQANAPELTISDPNTEVSEGTITPASNPKLATSDPNTGGIEGTIPPVSNPKLTTSDPITGVGEGTITSANNPKLTTSDPNTGLGEDAIISTSSPAPPIIDPNIGKVWDNFRLPRNIIPIHYHITMYPNFYDNNTKLYGHEIIEVEVVNATEIILIHYQEINIRDIEIIDINSGQPIAIRYFPYTKYNFLVMELSSHLRIGTRLNIEIGFEGPLEHSGIFRKNTGIYKLDYSTETGKTKSMVASMFHPASARTAFQCFDEPGFKANFSITLIHKPNYTALSNMPEESSTTSVDYPGLISTRFQTTGRMTTYSLGIIVCEFDYIENTSANGNLVRVWGERDKIPKLQFALDVATYLVDNTERYFDMADPMPKHDLIALPRYYYTAMESWGIMMFSSSIELDPINADERRKRSVARNIAHVFTLNWFGNLVTFDWWNDAWLHEAFATYFRYVFLDAYQPEWDIMMKYIPGEITLAMAADDVVSSRALIHDVTRHADIGNMFMGILYYKAKRGQFFTMYTWNDWLGYRASHSGGKFSKTVFSLPADGQSIRKYLHFLDRIYSLKGISIVRMMNNFMGPDNFRLALQTYIKNNAWGNVVTDDLWAAFSTIDGFSDIKTIMDTWTLQKGYPYINTTVQYDDSTGLTTVHATQHQFTKDSLQGDASLSPSMQNELNQSTATAWYVPLQFSTSNDPDIEQLVWINGTAVIFQVPLNISDKQSWIKFNPGMMGYYLVKYQDDMLNRLSITLQTDANILPPFDRFNLLNDAFRLTEAGLISYATALEITSYMYTPFGIMCSANEVNCLQHAGAMFRQWIDNDIEIDVALCDIVYVYGMRTVGTERDWEKVLNQYIADSAKPCLLQALASSSQPWITNRLLNMLAMNGSVIISDHVSPLFSHISNNPYGRDILWHWLRANWLTLTERDDVPHEVLERALRRVTSVFNTDAQLNEVKTFFVQYPGRKETTPKPLDIDAGPDVPNTGVTGGIKTSILERIKSNIKWMEKNYEAIVAWLKEHFEVF